MFEIVQLMRGPFCKKDLSPTLLVPTARSAIKILRRFFFLRCTTISHFSFLILIQAKLSSAIKRQHAQRANPSML